MTHVVAIAALSQIHGVLAVLTIALIHISAGPSDCPTHLMVYAITWPKGLQHLSLSSNQLNLLGCKAVAAAAVTVVLSLR